MKIELFWLLLTAILAASLWIPYIVGVNLQPKTSVGTDNFIVPPDPLKLKPWIARSYRAHQNLLEQFLPFAIIVLIGHLQGISNNITQTCVVVFFWLRVIHAIGMITAWARFPLRPIIFTSAWVVIIVHAWQLLSHAR
jgi:uncharacterized MAPEG superfamily protein